MIGRFARWWSDRSLRTKSLAVAAIPVLALGIAATTFGLSLQTEKDASDLVAHTIEVQTTIDRVLADLVDAETGVRGYTITGRPVWLEPYDRAVADIPGAVGRLQALVSDNPSQAARAQALQPAIDRRLDVAARLRAIAPITGSNRADVLSIMTQGKALMDNLRAQLGAMADDETRLLAQRRATLAASRDTSLFAVFGALASGILGGGLAAALLGSGVVGRVRRLKENARRLSRDQPLRGLPTGGDEIGQLSATLTEAQALLDARTAELRSTLTEAEDLYENAPVGYHSLDAEGRFVRINAAELGWLGRRREDVVGRPFTDFVSEDGHALFAKEFRALIEHGRIRDLRLELVSADGSTMPARLSATAVRDADGHYTQSRCVVEDVTEREQAERWAADLFDSFSAPVTIYEPVRDGAGEIVDFRRVYANPRNAEILGRPMSEVIGASLRETGLPHLFDKIFGTYVRVLRTGAPEQMPDIELTDRKTGLPFVLAVHVSRLGRSLAQVSRDVTLERTAEREITAARVEAERANLAKSEFLSRMSHELRTPLNAVLGFAQLLELDSLSSEQRESVKHIRRAGRHLLDLINEVLDISRIETGQMTISLEPVAVRDLLDEAVGLIGPLAEGRSITLDAMGAGCDAHVLADGQRLKQVLLNLLGNSVKYNREGGSVTVTCRVVARDRLRISVTDTGHGIRPDQLERLFRPFERLVAEQSEVEGTGIGLALSKGLVEAMGGRIGVESELDRGTTFWIELGLVESPLETYQDGRPDGEPPVAASSGRGHTVLHVEDNVSNLKLMEKIITLRADIELVSATQGQLGVDLARQYRPDLVLLDLHLPDMPGREVLRRLRTYPETQNTPIIIISADATKREIARLTADGASGYLTKPIDVGAFLELIDTVLGDLPANGALSDGRAVDRERARGHPVRGTGNT